MPTFHFDLIAMQPRLSSVIASLHFKQQVHADTKGFFQAQRHFRRNSGLAVGDIRERCAADTKDISGASVAWVNSALVMEMLLPDLIPICTRRFCVRNNTLLDVISILTYLLP